MSANIVRTVVVLGAMLCAFGGGYAIGHRTTFAPPPEPHPALSSLLAAIPMPDLRDCSPAMKELLSSDVTEAGRQ